MNLYFVVIVAEPSALQTKRKLLTLSYTPNPLISLLSFSDCVGLMLNIGWQSKPLFLGCVAWLSLKGLSWFYSSTPIHYTSDEIYVNVLV